MAMFWARLTIDQGRRQTTGCRDEFTSSHTPIERSCRVHFHPCG